MTKKEIVRTIAERLNESQLRTKEIVQLTFDLLVETLVEEGRIELRKFGVFEVKRRKPRRARNPRTNQPVEVEAKNVVTFQPGKVMEEKVKRAKKVIEPKRKPRKVAARVSKTAETPPPESESALPDLGKWNSQKIEGSIQQPPIDDETAPSPDLPNKPR